MGRTSAASSTRSAPYNKKNVNDGRRNGARVSLLFQPTPELKITPRVVYQEVRSQRLQSRGHLHPVRQSVRLPRNDLGKRKQYLKLREKFPDKTLLTDLVASYDFGPAELTSVTSYVHRNILVSRDASALTDSVYVASAAFLNATLTR